MRMHFEILQRTNTEVVRLEIWRTQALRTNAQVKVSK